MAKAAAIYLIEDDESIRELVLYALESAGYAVRGFADGGQFWQALAEGETPGLILLDIMLPGEDGLTILRRLKASARLSDTPVIMLTAKAAEYDKVRGLDLGADDYVTKPFGVMELLSRVRAVLRRAAAVKTSECSQFICNFPVAFHIAVTESRYNAGQNRFLSAILIKFQCKNSGRLLQNSENCGMIFKLFQQ